MKHQLIKFIIYPQGKMCYIGACAIYHMRDGTLAHEQSISLQQILMRDAFTLAYPLDVCRLIHRKVVMHTMTRYVNLCS